MKQTGIILALFGVLLIVFPQLLAYLLGGFFVAIGVILFMTDSKLRKQAKHQESYVKFGNYKIYR